MLSYISARLCHYIRHPITYWVLALRTVDIYVFNEEKMLGAAFRDLYTRD